MIQLIIRCVILGFFLGTFSIYCFGQNAKTYIPQNAFVLLPVIPQEVAKVFPMAPSLAYFMALGEQESCLSLKHSRCFKSNSKLQTERELGVGIFQITKAYNKDGSVRFDTLTEMRNRYKVQLAELQWNGLELRPDLQVRAMMLMVRDDYAAFSSVKDCKERNKFTDSAYNAGRGRVIQDRRLCSLKANCNPDIWDNNVEKVSTLSTKPIYGNRSPYDINREHVRAIWTIRIQKYEAWYAANGYTLDNTTCRY